MRILYLCPYIPYPPYNGGRIRIFKLLREAARSHRIHFLSLYEEGADEHRSHFEEVCEAVELFPMPTLGPTTRREQLLRSRPRILQMFYSRELQERITLLLAEDRFDLVHVEELVMAQYLLPIASPLPVVLSRQKIDSDFAWHSLRIQPWGRERLHRIAEALKVHSFERHVAGRPWHHLVLKTEDRDLTWRHNPRLPVSLVPMGTDTEFFEPAPLATEPVLTFLGAMWFEPNADAVRFFFDQIYPHLSREVEGLAVNVVGHAPPPDIKELERRPGVTVTGTVPDVRPYFAASAICIVPMRVGGGERTKILDAMAMGIPVVSTSVGAEGLGCVDGDNIFIADEPREFAARILLLLAEPELRRRVGAAGREFVVKNRSWRVLGQQLDAVYAQAATELTRGLGFASSNISTEAYR